MQLTDSSRNGAELDGKGTAAVDLTLTNLTGYLYGQWDEDGGYMQTASREGEWHFRFPVTVDESANESFAVNKEQDGFLVKNAVKTKAGLVVEIEIAGMDRYSSMHAGIKDAQGNWLQCLSRRTDQHGDGSASMQVMALYDGQKELSFQASAREGSPRELVNIDFQIP